MVCETSLGGAAGDPSFSLTRALRAIAGQVGYVLDGDELHAALGLSVMMVAAPGENPASWPTHARDAFLIESGRLFGLEIREIHPPEAACGLDQAEEYRQHFDASYRPLIAQALDHNQRVLVWQGWSGDRAGLWGVITGTDEGEVGFSGGVAGTARAPALGEPVALTRMPVQLYVVEGIAPVVPSVEALLAVAMDRARQGLGNEFGDRFGVVTGLSAYDVWTDRVEANASSGAGRPEDAVGHRRLAGSVVAGHESAVRFFKPRKAAGPKETRGLIEALLTACEGIIASLSGVTDEMGRTPAGRTELVGRITRARDAGRQMLVALQSNA